MGGKITSSMACSSMRPRRRRRVVTEAAISRDASPRTSLHEDLTSLVAWWVLTGDLREFHAVCCHWRSSIACPHGRGVADPRFHPWWWMLFPEGHGLYPGHGKLHRHDHCVLDSIDDNLLLQRDPDTTIRLLHPFTGDILDFPSLETLLPWVI
ncbi:hypothetical protein SETIT_6G212400v2 [Setaria italica]|uniref:F-box domain-containing protein n=1 Tax=Setaria italica TaxID=4555 RepID=K3YN10_SETIT|nr:hypothetical protein SETIT_6G212400v2 [Setaria italica]